MHARSAITLLGLLLASPAMGHGHASWIMNNPQTSYCCGERDCRPLADSEVLRTPAGWVVNGRLVPPRSIYPTQDGTSRFWACFVEPALTEPRCLFIPAMF